MLREIDERKLINTYARLMYNDDSDGEDDTKIRTNLTELLDWDVYGDNGLGIYCSKFEKIKDVDWPRLIEFIKSNRHEIKALAYAPRKDKRIKKSKVIRDFIKAREAYLKEKFTDENYKVSGRGKKAKTCIYEGRKYKSRQEAMYKEGISRSQLYKYLKNTNQL